MSGGRWCSSVVTIALISMLSNLVYFLLATAIVIQPQMWSRGDRWLRSWVFSNNWDSQLTQLALHSLSLINMHRSLILMLVTAISALHMFNCVLVLIGINTNRVFLMLPWLIQEALMLCLLTSVLVSWAFISFFIDVLLAFVSPLITGLLLGLNVFAWRQVWHVFSNNDLNNTHNSHKAIDLYHVHNDNHGYTRLEKGHSRHV